MSEASTAFFIVLQDMKGIIGMWVLEHVDLDCNLFGNSKYFVSLPQFSHLYNGGDNIYLNIIIRRWNNMLILLLVTYQAPNNINYY